MNNDARRKAANKYQSEKCKVYALKVNINSDSDIIEYMENVTNKQAELKRLIREEIARKKEI